MEKRFSIDLAKHVSFFYRQVLEGAVSQLSLLRKHLDIPRNQLDTPIYICFLTLSISPRFCHCTQARMLYFIRDKIASGSENVSSFKISMEA